MSMDINNSAIHIRPLDDGKFLVNGAPDDDDDATRTGVQSDRKGHKVGAAGGQVVDLPTLNKMLASTGYSVNDRREVVTAGGQRLTPQALSVVMANEPVLPPVAGAVAPLNNVGNSVQAQIDQTMSGASIATLTALFMDQMLQAVSDDMNAAKRIKRGMETSKLLAKDQEYKDTQKRIDGERKSSDMKVIAAGAAMGTSIVVGMAGARLAAAGSTPMLAGALTAAGNQSGNLVDAGVMNYDKTRSGGGAYQADEASKRIILDQKKQEEVQQVIDESQAMYDKALDEFKKILQVMQQTVELSKQGTDRLG